MKTFHFSILADTTYTSQTLVVIFIHVQEPRRNILIGATVNFMHNDKHPHLSLSPSPSLNHELYELQNDE